MTAPKLNPIPSPAFPGTFEGLVNPGGVSVATLVVDGSITDPDGAVEAIAITAFNTSLGTWQYSLDGGLNWQGIRADLINSNTNLLALLLAPTNQIRLLPFGDFNGNLGNAVTFYAWDMSSGSAGQYAVATPGTGAFSSASASASILITPVNDAPTFGVPNGTGYVKLTFNSGGDTSNSVAVQPDGKIVVVGSRLNATTHNADAVEVIRLNSNGTFDSSFRDGTPAYFLS